jgi:hypothetical protein
LGELNDSAPARWLKTLEICYAQGESRQLKVFPSDIEPPAADAAGERTGLPQPFFYADGKGALGAHRGSLMLLAARLP